MTSRKPATVQGPISVTGLGAGLTLRGIDYRPTTGQLFGVAVTSGSVNNSPLTTFAIDPATGGASLVGQTTPLAAAADVPGDIDFNPAVPTTPVDRIRYVDASDENARVNPNNGALAGDDPNLTAAAEILGAAYDRNTSTSTTTTLYEVNRTSSMLSLQGGIDGAPSANGGQIADLGTLGVVLTPGVDAGFDISPTGTAYAALTVGGVTGLYTVGLPTRTTTTLVGPIGGAPAQVYDLAIGLDTDGDGLLFASDNCPAAANADQADLDSDHVGDPCDADQDGDGLSNALEAALGTDPRSANSDGDGVPDGGDACPTLAGTLANGCPDIQLPETKITTGPKKKTSKTTAKLKFESSEAGSTFACSLDDKAFKPCTSPRKLKHLKGGEHSFEVRAIDPAGNLDPTPARRAWRIQG